VQAVVAVFTVHDQPVPRAREIAKRVANEVKFQRQVSSGSIDCACFKQIRTLYCAQSANNGDP
jgi:hypothetical protein